MNCIISTRLNTVLDPPTIALWSLKVTPGITVTRLEVSLKKLSLQQSLFRSTRKDVGILQIQGMPLTRITVCIEGSKTLGRLVHRLTPTFQTLGVDITTKLRITSVEGMFHLAPTLPLYGIDLPYLVETLHRIYRRAMGNSPYAQRPFTLFDLKRLTGLEKDIKDGDEEARDVEDWITARSVPHKVVLPY